MKKRSFSLFWKGIKTSLKSMSLTMRHLRQSLKSRKIQDIRDKNFFESKTGITTLNYPYQSIPVPDHGRYQLYNEIEDCIVCDKCAKVCPVDCIDIEPIKSVGEFGKTSDGTSKRIYAARFDIDMAKCCFCGLCTTVCPTECLTMTDEYDFSVFDLGKMNFGFGNMTEQEAEAKRKEWEENQVKKAAEKEKNSIASSAAGQQTPGRPMRPTLNPIGSEEKKGQLPEEDKGEITQRPSMRPVLKSNQAPVVFVETPESNDLNLNQTSDLVAEKKEKPEDIPSDSEKAEIIKSQEVTDVSPEKSAPEVKKFVPRSRPVIKNKPSPESGENG